MTFLSVGDPVPWFTLPSTSSPRFHFDTVGGYRVVMFFFGSSQHPDSAIALEQFTARQEEFAALETIFFGISIDPEDTYLADTIEHPTYVKFLWDFDRTISQQYGICEGQGDQTRYQPTTLVLDENLRVLGVFPLSSAPQAEHADQVTAFLKALPTPAPARRADRQAPVLLIPRVFEPEFCRHLIRLYEADGGRDSGFMREKDGKTVEVYDYDFKTRRDFNLGDTASDTLQQVNDLVIRRVKPEIEKVHQFRITRFERHVVACYEAERQGFFRRHRDNTTKGTAHRRFAMTINLNTGEYEGGCLWFPEYGTQQFRPEIGEAIIFSCSLLHEVTPVLSGKRFALLSFFYDDAGAALRERNKKYLELGDRPSSSSPRTSAAPANVKKSKGFQPRK